MCRGLFFGLIHLSGKAVRPVRSFIRLSALSIIDPLLVAVPALEHEMSGPTACRRFGSGFGLIGDRCTYPARGAGPNQEVSWH